MQGSGVGRVGQKGLNEEYQKLCSLKDLLKVECETNTEKGGSDTQEGEEGHGPHSETVWKIYMTYVGTPWQIQSKMRKQKGSVGVYF